MEVSEPVSVEQVLLTIQAALAIDNTTRSAAEGCLRAWEADAAPGFLVALMRIVEQQSIDAASRLLAAVIAKNAVGSSWRKTMGTREWSRVPEEEKRMVKEATISLMLSEPNERIATQLTLLLTNISRFDFPGRAPDLLTRLLQASAAPDAQLSPTARLRAMKALRSVLAGLSTKRFVIEAPLLGAGSPGQGAPGLADLRMLSQHINSERELFKKKLAEALQPLGEVFIAHCEAFMTCAQGWDFHAPMAKAAATATAELLVLTPVPPEQLPPGGETLLKHMHTAILALTHLQPGQPYTGLPPQQQEVWRDLGGKLCERMTRAVIAALDHYPIPFAALLPPFLSLYVETALITLDAPTVRAMRPKRRVLMVRFIAKALLNPFYRPEWASAPIPAALAPGSQQRMALEASRARAMVAHAALTNMLNLAEGPCGPLVEAIIAKYVALTPEELEEWRTDPESYARSMDVESGPDADTPRPIGVGLLLCMLERGGEDVVQALLSLAQRVQAMAPPTQESILIREACYRCIGEGFNHITDTISFQSWYENELSPMLSTQLPDFLTGTQDLFSSVLQARALWLLGVCGQNLDPAHWCAAYQLVVQHMASKDLVVALTAVSSALSLTAAIMDDQQAIEQYVAATKPKSGMPNMMEALHIQETAAAIQQQGSEADAMIQETKARVEHRQAALAETMTAALSGSFQLLEQLTEVESMVRVLQLVSVLVEVMGTRIRPHLGVIAAALPHIWATASSHASSSSSSSPGFGGAASNKGSSDTGAVVRLHSALIAVLTHLVGKLRAVAVQDPQIAGVVFPMLTFSTSLGSQESECLVEEAFRLWNTTISSLPEVPPQLLALLPHLGALLTRGKDNAAVFPIIESYLLLGAAAALTPLSQAIQVSLERTVLAVTQAVVESMRGSASGQQQQQQQQGPKTSSGRPRTSSAGAGAAGTRALSPETANEAMAAAALADVMLQLFPQDTPALLASTFKAMAALVAHPDLVLQGLNVKVLNVMEGFLEVLGRLLLMSPGLYGALLEGLPAGASGRFLDRWLHIASARFLEEVIGVKTMAMLGRYRRRIATASLGSVIAADTCPDVYERSKMVRVVTLSLQALLDNQDFHADQADLDALDFKSDLAEDFVMVRRLAITRADPIRNMNLPEKVRALLLHFATKTGGEAALCELVEQQGSPRLVSQLTAVLRGQLDLSDSGDEELLYGPNLLPSRGMSG